MLRLSFALAVLAASAAAALAQETDASPQAGTTQSTMARLLADGYEIKGTAQASSRYIVFMQKEKTAYACQFVTVTTTRCGLITE